MKLALIDWLVLVVYLAAVTAIGFALRGRVRDSDDFLLAGRSIPAWAAGLAFLSANLGAQEVIGMAASGAKYGIATSHFYWVGAIPAMVFLGVFMMPFYYGSRARSVPEYLRLRFDEKTRTWNAATFAGMTVFSSGISLYALARLLLLLHVLDAPAEAVGFPTARLFDLCVVLSAAFVLVYVLAGGLTSAIYNEVLQFFLIVAGFLPLVLIGLHGVGGWSGIVSSLPAAWTHTWRGMGDPQTNRMGVDAFGLVAGLGFVLSFGYWCTDFLVVQRALAARDLEAARRTPIIAAWPKMLFPFLVILPGLIALATHPPADGLIPVRFDPSSGLPMLDATGRPVLDYDLAMPVTMAHYLPSGLLGLAFTALVASFMSGMAGNVTAFNTVATFDLWQAHLRPHASDRELLQVGRGATVLGIVASIGTAYLARSFNDIMDLLQLVFAFVNAPLFATFLLGMFWRGATGDGAFAGLVLGTATAAAHHGLTLPATAHPGIQGGWIRVLHEYPSEMAQNFWTAIWAWSVCFVVTVGVSLVTRGRPSAELRGLVWSLTPRPEAGSGNWLLRPAVQGALVLAVTLLLNFLFA